MSDEYCGACDGTHWTEDENWQGPNWWRPGDGPMPPREPQDGMQPCGLCSEGEWDHPWPPTPHFSAFDFGDQPEHRARFAKDTRSHRPEAMSEDTKTCRRCDRALPLSAFYKQAKCRLGVRPECKNCTKAEREASGKTATSYARALRRLRDAYPRDFAAFLAQERGHDWEPSPDPESADYWRGRWADAAAALADALCRPEGER